MIKIIKNIKTKLIKKLLDYINEDIFITENILIIKNFKNTEIIENNEFILINKNNELLINTPTVMYNENYLFMKRPYQKDGIINDSKLCVLIKDNIKEENDGILKTDNYLLIKSYENKDGIIESKRNIVIDKRDKQYINTPTIMYNDIYLLIKKPEEKDGIISNSKLCVLIKDNIKEENDSLLKTDSYLLLKSYENKDGFLETKKHIVIDKHNYIDFNYNLIDVLKKLNNNKNKIMSFSSNNLLELESIIYLYKMFIRIPQMLNIDYFKYSMEIENNSKKIFFDSFSENKKFTIANTNINFIEQSSFWITYHEIFLNQEFYFNSKKDDPLIIDCGANIGLGILYWKNLYPNSKIVAFEPVPQITAVLNQNIKENKLDNVIIEPFALLDKDSEIEFFLPKNDSTAGSLFCKNNSMDFEVLKIKTKKLSEYLKDYNTIDFLKIDIEGAEDKVLLDIESELKKIENIFIEFHDGEDFDRGRLSLILTILERNNFVYNISKSWSNQRSTSFKPFEYLKEKRSNVIFAKRSH